MIVSNLLVGSLNHHDGHGESVSLKMSAIALKMSAIALWLAFSLGSCVSSLKNSNNASDEVNKGCVSL